MLGWPVPGQSQALGSVSCVFTIDPSPKLVYNAVQAPCATPKAFPATVAELADARDLKSNAWRTSLEEKNPLMQGLLWRLTWSAF